MTSQWTAHCKEPKAHREAGAWEVVVRKVNYSAFNGGRRTPSPYSQVRCTACPAATWRTKAAYVDRLPDAR